MSDKDKSFTPARTLEPGTIDKIRKNLGPIDAQEAIIMQKKLGGEILKERASSVEPVKLQNKRPPRQEFIRTSGMSSADISAKSASLNSINNTKQMANVNQLVNTNTTQKKVKIDAELPAITMKDLKLMDNLMISPDYEIKPNFGLFNIFYRLSSKNRKKISKTFGEYIIKRHVEHLQAFTSTIKTFIQLSPDSYKSKIATEQDLKFKFLRTVGKWSLRDIKVLSIDVQNMADNLTVAMLIPFVRAVYKEVITIYYVGEQQVSALIKEVYSDIISYSDSDRNKMQILAKQGITEWIYIYNQIIKGMYPLLMRMCSSEYEAFPKFFTAKIADILQFLNISKFDLLLPEKKKVKQEEKKVEKKRVEEFKKVVGKKDGVVEMGLQILEQLFPQAGFSRLDEHPDMYPYFQPLYNFADGFNMLHSKNPLQVTIVLIRILEDFFQGCRNIDFNINGDDKLAALPDDLSEAMSDWASYHEDLFDKKLGDYLRNYVNAIYSQNEYENSQYGKETLNNILWRIKLYFLPHFQFSAPILQKPINDSKYKALYNRTDYIRNVFTTLVQRIDENSESKKYVLGVMNPWERYIFDIPNTISKRLDVLLGAKRPDDRTAATNANLIKYTYCIMAVLDWWINNPMSPAYSVGSDKLYRISDKDGQPQFSVPVRSDQNQLFASALKKAVSVKES